VFVKRLQNSMLQALARELFSEMIPVQPVVMDRVYHSFVVSVCDRVHGSQINILHVRLRHILFEETLRDFATLLHETLIQPLSMGEFPLFEIHDRFVQFFAEGAEVTMDDNLNYYEGHELADIMSQFEPILSFTLYQPHTGQTRVRFLQRVDQIQGLHEDFRIAQLLE
jgi:hypothetical protein